MGPSLVEPGVKYFLGETLKKCGENKSRLYNYLFNTFIFIVFILAILLFLYVKYNSHNNNELKKLNKQKEEDYMLDLIHKIQTEKRIKTGSKITDLPDFESEYEITMKKFI